MLKVRAGRKEYEVWAWDIESHNDEESIANNTTGVWLYSFINDESKIDDESSYGYDLETFISKLEEMTKPYRNEKRTRKTRRLLIYVWNLAFEWSFLLQVLINHGFTWKEKIEKEDSYVFTSVSNKSCSSVWCSEIKFGAKNGVIMFKDMAKILTGRLRDVAKAYNLPTQKGDIDYRLNRLHDYHVTKEEKEYCFKDTRIVMDLALEMAKIEDKDFFASSSASSYSCRKMIKRGYPHTMKPMKKFREEYPLLGKEESEFLRLGVAGGITYAPSRYQFKDIKDKVLHIDMHSAHPTSAYLNKYPYGEGIYFKGKPPTNGFYISACRIKISYTDVKLHSVIKLIGYDVGVNEELVVWSFELGVLKECYVDLEIEYIDGYAYKTKMLPWREFYNDNYQDRKKAKKKKDGFHVMLHKLFLNSSYGKLLEKGHQQLYANYITPNGLIDSHIVDKQEICTNAKYTYLPVGSAIAARTRVRLIKTALLIGWEYIVYFDTDSIFFIDNEITRERAKKINMKDELGGWGYELNIERMQVTCPKRYKIIEVDETGHKQLTAHLAGVNFRERLSEESYDDLNIVDGDYTIQGVKHAVGGTLIVFKDKKLQIQKKYDHVAKNNLDGYNKYIDRSYPI